MLTIGLTGGIGTGKSTVAKILNQLGARVLDADKVGHDIYLPGGPAYDEVKVRRRRASRGYFKKSLRSILPPVAAHGKRGGGLL